MKKNDFVWLWTATALFAMIVVLLAGCAHAPVRLYEGSRLPQAEVSRLYFGANDVVSRIDSIPVLDSREGRSVELLPGTHTITLRYLDSEVRKEPHTYHITVVYTGYDPSIATKHPKITSYKYRYQSSNEEQVPVNLEVGKTYRLRTELKHVDLPANWPAETGTLGIHVEWRTWVEEFKP
jgi:hypothetical protein